MSLQPPLTPRIGQKLHVLAITRISTEHQDKRSLEDQKAKIQEFITANYSGPVNWHIIASRGSGENLERKELHEAEDLIESNAIDLVLAEDLARICRRNRAFNFCEMCVDHETRLIALNDRIDTGEEGWQDSAFIATWHHERSNRDTSQRIRRSLRHRFTKGGIIQYVIYGYIKPPGAESDAELAKRLGADQVYKEWFRRLENGATYAEIADWLNAIGESPGPFSRTKNWSGPMVARITHNPILKGVRTRNKMISRRVNKTGRRRSVKAPPQDLLQRTCPHLAFFPADYYDRIIRLVDARNSQFRRRDDQGQDCRLGVSRMRTIWPGQHLRCGICGRLCYWSGRKQNKLMRCSGNQNYKCWNGVEVNGAMVGCKLAEAILAKIEALPGFDQTLIEDVKVEWRAQENDRGSRLKELLARKLDLDQQIDRTTDAIARLHDSQALLEKLQQLETRRGEVVDQVAMMEQAQASEPILPSLDEIKAMARELFTGLATSDPEVGRILKVVLRDLKAYPYQLCGGGAVVWRAHFTLDLAGLSSQITSCSASPQALQHEMIVDLFDLPQRVNHRAEVIARRANGETEKQVAQALGITKTAVQNAAALHRLMEKLGIQDPYQPLNEPPAKGFRRHLHPRYRFDPLPPEGAA
ncbi:MAG: recombinase family protein [Planctomycetes bacterium]|nr:recombinase family protein [Planctomycetota bacterium]